MISPPRWARERLDQQRLKALARFIEERKQSQTAEYLQEFEAYRRQVSDLFDTTQDLTAFSSTTVKEGRLLDVARFLAVPPWSRDDLATVSGAKTPHKGRLMEEQLDAVVFVLERSWDPARFPWLAERRRPTTAEREVALRWTASIGAIERMRTKMRMSGSRRQQKSVEAVFEASGYARRRRLKRISALHHLPVGEFAGEIDVAGTKADIAARLTDERLLALEGWFLTAA